MMTTTRAAGATPVHTGRRTQVWQTRLETEDGSRIALQSAAQRSSAVEWKGHAPAHPRKTAASFGEFSNISSSKRIVPF